MPKLTQLVRANRHGSPANADQIYISKPDFLGNSMQVRFHSAPVLTSLLVAGLLSLMSGCSGGDNLTAVSGVVKADGKVVTDGEIMFHPVAGGRPSMGVIGEGGRYELTSKTKGDGVAPGEYKVTITAMKTIAPKNAGPAPESVDEETLDNMAEQRIVWLIPSKYSESATSTLTAKVEDGKPNEINFDSADFE